MNFLARAITKRSIKEVLKVIETYFLGPTNDLIFVSISVKYANADTQILTT